MKNESRHIPVLLKEAIDVLDLQEGDTYLDATLGIGGHAEEVWRRMGDKVEIIGIDADSQAVEAAKKRFESQGASYKIFRTLNFKNLDELEPGLRDKPIKILFDLGWNKMQFEEGERGFSFLREEPLVMTFSQESGTAPFTAYDIVNSWEEDNLETIISAYGEERFAKKIAKAIARSREEKPIKTSLQLAEIVKEAVPIWYRFGRIHPATRTFQALRIAANDELRALEEGLAKAWNIADKRGGGIAVISFHSLEDRIVKNFFKNKMSSDQCQILTKKPIVPTEKEVEENPRSRSAKLRAIKTK